MKRGKYMRDVRLSRTYGVLLHVCVPLSQLLTLLSANWCSIGKFGVCEVDWCLLRGLVLSSKYWY